MNSKFDKRTNHQKNLKGGDDYRMCLKLGENKDPKTTQANMLPHDGLVPESELKGHRLPVRNYNKFSCKMH